MTTTSVAVTNAAWLDLSAELPGAQGTGDNLKADVEIQPIQTGVWLIKAAQQPTVGQIGRQLAAGETMYLPSHLISGGRERWYALATRRSGWIVIDDEAARLLPR